MWYNIGLKDWFFDSDTPANMNRLVPTVLEMAKNPEAALQKTQKVKELVEKRQAETMKILGVCLE